MGQPQYEVSRKYRFTFYLIAHYVSDGDFFLHGIILCDTRRIPA